MSNYKIILIPLVIGFAFYGQFVVAANNPDPVPINKKIFERMFTYAHLIDISYCISKFSSITEPFNCDLSCSTAFPNMTLVHQWHFDDSVCGYIATTHDDIFDEPDGLSSKKKVIISLRGTRSLFDTYADLKVDMTKYKNPGLNVQSCGQHCMVHRGFYEYFLSSLQIIGDLVELEMRKEEAELYILGHSLGGAVALLLGMHYLDFGYSNLTIVTMGQPLTGNKEFSNWVDKVTGSNILTDAKGRRFFRVVHKNDVICTIPNSDNPLAEYTQFNNQIYLNISSFEALPMSNEVLDCKTGSNEKCIAGDSIYLHSPFMLDSHTNYFRKMGLCRFSI